jgi:hypothetical protein
MSTLENISDWNLEARREPEQYFLYSSDISKISEGKRSIILGRRGTGKSAIAAYLERTFPSSQLRFDLSAFSNILANRGINDKHEFITVWKNTILTSAMKVIYTRFPERMDYDTRELLAKIYDDIPISPTYKERFFKKFGAGISFLGLRLDASFEASDIQNVSLRKSNEAIENLIARMDLGSRVFVVFDDIDDNMEASSNDKEIYRNLLIALVKSVLHVRNGPVGNIVTPILCMRDDVFNVLEDDDVSKWSDVTHRLRWSDENITELLTKRISVDSNVNSSKFVEILPLIYSGPVKNGSNEIEFLKIIKGYSQGRPRDYIAYIRELARFAISNNRKLIKKDDFKAVESAFSVIALQEIKAELRTNFQDYNKALNVITKIGKPIFIRDQFERLYTSGSREATDDCSSALLALVRLNVLGVPIGPTVRFSYQELMPITQFDQKFVVHYSLLKALQLY